MAASAADEELGACRRRISKVKPNEYERRIAKIKTTNANDEWTKQKRRIRPALRTTNYSFLRWSLKNTAIYIQCGFIGNSSCQFVGPSRCPCSEFVVPIHRYNSSFLLFVPRAGGPVRPDPPYPVASRPPGRRPGVHRSPGGPEALPRCCLVYSLNRETRVGQNLDPG